MGSRKNCLRIFHPVLPCLQSVEALRFLYLYKPSLGNININERRLNFLVPLLRTTSFCHSAWSNPAPHKASRHQQLCSPDKIKETGNHRVISSPQPFVLYEIPQNIINLTKWEFFTHFFHQWFIRICKATERTTSFSVFYDTIQCAAYSVSSKDYYSSLPHPG